MDNLKCDFSNGVEFIQADNRVLKKTMNDLKCEFANEVKIIQS